MGVPFPGPVPPYTNPPIQPQYLQPGRIDIANITLGQTTLVTTAVTHDYVIGQLVKLLVPEPYGSYQLNEKQGYVLSIPAADQVVLDIDSSQNVNSYITNPLTRATSQIIPIGDINSGIISATGRVIPITFIPGSFINSSP